jgi:hypothetical protein
MLAKSVRSTPNAPRARRRTARVRTDAVTATEVMVTVTPCSRPVNLQVFELGMWQAWSGR